MNLKSRSHFALICLSTVALMLVSCDDHIPMLEHNKHDSWQDVTHTGLPQIISMEAKKPSVIGASAGSLTMIEDSNDAKSSSTDFKTINDKSPCSILLKNNIDSSMVELDNKSTSGNYCEYRIYPNKGQTIFARSSSGNMKVSLVVPYYHDFDNGGYKVKQYDKHVVRIDYSNARYLPNAIKNDINISIN